MKLEKKDMAYLIGVGVDKSNLSQIEEAAGCTKYTLLDERGKDIRKIGRSSAIKILGRDKWLAGLERSAFHWTCVMDCENGSVYFDSKALFR